jgi:Putative zinc-finger
MPHIPEDELHAYLDQALSRSQCVEIESHLASCPACQGQRDGIAALRDRTTAMLAVLAPPASLPPSIDAIRIRAGVLQSRRHRLVRLGSWAASIVAALGLGWSAHVWAGRDTGRERAAEPRDQEAVNAVPEAAAAQSSSIPDSSARSSAPSSRHIDVSRSPIVRQVATNPGASGERPALTDTSRAPAQPLSPTVHGQAADRGSNAEDSTRFSQVNSTVLANEREIPELATESMWRIVSVAAAEEESGAPLPSVPGLQVVQVKVQGLRPNEKIVAVDQQLATGEVIRTIEGPAAQMTDLLAHDGRDRTTAASRAFDALMTLRFGDRIVAIRGPADSLRALMNRLAMPVTKP